MSYLKANFLTIITNYSGKGKNTDFVGGFPDDGNQLDYYTLELLFSFLFFVCLFYFFETRFLSATALAILELTL